jgi:hypothetical protein
MLSCSALSLASHGEPLQSGDRLRDRREPQVQRGKNAAARKQRQSGRNARQERRPIAAAEHRNERNTEKDIAGGQRQVLPAVVADLQKQLLNRGHFDDPLRQTTVMLLLTCPGALLKNDIRYYRNITASLQTRLGRPSQGGKEVVPAR